MGVSHKSSAGQWLRDNATVLTVAAGVLIAGAVAIAQGEATASALSEHETQPAHASQLREWGELSERLKNVCDRSDRIELRLGRIEDKLDAHMSKEARP